MVGIKCTIEILGGGGSHNYNYKFKRYLKLDSSRFAGSITLFYPLATNRENQKLG